MERFSAHVLKVASVWSDSPHILKAASSEVGAIIRVSLEGCIGGWSDSPQILLKVTSMGGAILSIVLDGSPVDGAIVRVSIEGRIGGWSDAPQSP